MEQGAASKSLCAPPLVPTRHHSSVSPSLCASLLHPPRSLSRCLPSLPSSSTQLPRLGSVPFTPLFPPPTRTLFLDGRIRLPLQAPSYWRLGCRQVVLAVALRCTCCCCSARARAPERVRHTHWLAPSLSLTPSSLWRTSRTTPTPSRTLAPSVSTSYVTRSASSRAVEGQPAWDRVLPLPSLAHRTTSSAFDKRSLDAHRLLSTSRLLTYVLSRIWLCYLSAFPRVRLLLLLLLWA